MKDCFGVEYQLVMMPGNGICGYSCLAHALTGDRHRYSEVVEDLLKAFYANPQIFIQQTEFARKNSNLTHYVNQMRLVMKNVHKQPVLPMFWMEDARLVAFSLVYDVTVFVYDSVNRKWYVYGNGARKGYICLLSSGEHFDVLEGAWPHEKPPVPRRAKQQGLNRQTLGWQPVQVDVEKYPYARVSKWDNDEAVLVENYSSSSPLRRCSYADIVKGRISTSSSTRLESGLKTQECHQHLWRPLPKRDPIECSVCGRKCVSKNALRVHWTTHHRDDAVFADDIRHELHDTGYMESVESENAGVMEAKECGTSDESEIESVESAEIKAAADNEMESLENEESGMSVTKESTGGTKSDTTSTDYEDKSGWRKIKTKAYCGTCLRTFKSSRALNVHTTKMHSQPNSTKVNNVPTHKCTINSKSKNTETKTVKCLLGNKQFSSKQALALHIKRTHKYLDSDDNVVHQQHDDVQPDFEESSNSSHKIRVQSFPCKACKKVFGTIRGLKTHETRKHKMCEKPLQCGICNTTFDSQQRLDKHTANAHSVINSAVGKGQAPLKSTHKICLVTK